MYRSGIVFVDFLLNVPVQTSQNRNGYTLLPHDSYLKGYKKEALRSKIRPRFCLFPAKWILAKGHSCLYIGKLEMWILADGHLYNKIRVWNQDI